MVAMGDKTEPLQLASAVKMDQSKMTPEQLMMLGSHNSLFSWSQNQ
jgi:hypothetical protein